MAAITLLASCAAPELDPEIQAPEGETDKPRQTITINAVEVLPDGATKAIHGTEADETSTGVWIIIGLQTPLTVQ